MCPGFARGFPSSVWSGVPCRSHFPLLGFPRMLLPLAPSGYVLPCPALVLRPPRPLVWSVPLRASSCAFILNRSVLCRQAVALTGSILPAAHLSWPRLLRLRCAVARRALASVPRFPFCSPPPSFAPLLCPQGRVVWLWLPLADVRRLACPLSRRVSPLRSGWPTSPPVSSGLGRLRFR